MSNYGAGFAILMGRQFAAGNSITIGKIPGVVHEITLAATVLTGDESVTDAPASQIGIHDFTYGGVILGLRYWVPGNHYFQNRYRINPALLNALKGIDITLLAGTRVIRRRRTAVIYLS